MDILRGLAIISVVFGHLIPAPWGCYPFLFHMPLFFMLSGFFYRPNSDLRLFARQKGWTLLVPYGIYLFMIQFGLFFEYGRRLWECTGSAQVFVILSNFVNQLGDLAFGGRMLGGDVGPFWFVPCLFICQQIFNVLMVKVRSWFKIALIIVLAYVLGCMNQCFLPDMFIALDLNVVLVALGFYALGYLWGCHRDCLRHKAICIGAWIVVGIVSLIYEDYPHLCFNMKIGVYGIFLLSPLIACAYGVVLEQISRTLVATRAIAVVLSHVGAGSITTLFLHQFFYNLYVQSDTRIWLLAHLEYEWFSFNLQNESYYAVVGVLIACNLVHALFVRVKFTRHYLLGRV